MLAGLASSLSKNPPAWVSSDHFSYEQDCCGDLRCRTGHSSSGFLVSSFWGSIWCKDSAAMFIDGNLTNGIVKVNGHQLLGKMDKLNSLLTLSFYKYIYIPVSSWCALLCNLSRRLHDLWCTATSPILSLISLPFFPGNDGKAITLTVTPKSWGLFFLDKGGIVGSCLAQQPYPSLKSRAVFRITAIPSWEQRWTYIYDDHHISVLLKSCSFSCQ